MKCRFGIFKNDNESKKNSVFASVLPSSSIYLPGVEVNCEHHLLLNSLPWWASVASLHFFKNLSGFGAEKIF